MKLAHWAATDTILEYTGNPYMYVSGAFTTSMHESAIVKLEDPLPALFAQRDAGIVHALQRHR